MNDLSISSALIKGQFVLKSAAQVQISIVAYEHQAGMPARFYAGLLPAIDLARKIKFRGAKPIIRVIDPSPIANYCNEWEIERPRFRTVIAEFLRNSNVEFFFDTAEKISDESLEVLRALGTELETSTDEKLIAVVRQIRESGRKHGGDSGADNALIYMAAHPFSWLDMYHPLIWKRKYPEDCQFVNLLSKSEERFSVVRKFLKNRRLDLPMNANPTDQYLTICSTPCYIPLDGEPTLENLADNGYGWCYSRYLEIKKISRNYERACEDFRSLMSFLGLKES